MNVRIEFHPLALEEFIQSYDWYEEKSPGLGDRFSEKLEERLRIIEAYPDRYPVKKKKFREVRIAEFPFSIVYKYYPPKKVVLVVHIFHGKRNPLKKFKIGS